MCQGALLVGLAAVAAAGANAQVTTGDSFDWSGRLPAGATLRVYSVDGAVTVSRSSGDQAVIHGQRRGRTSGYSRHEHGSERWSDRPLAFERLQDGDNVTVCAYEADGGSCSAHGVREWPHHDRWESSPSADFTVQLPAGVKITVGTGDGDVSVREAGADVSVSTGDGEITIDRVSGPVHASSGDGRVSVSAATGPVEASTGDGAIEVHMASLAHPQDMHFSTGDGPVTLYLPASFSGELDVDTGDGRIESDFPLEVRGHLDRSHVHAAIGGGGSAQLTVSTGEGDVRIKKD